MGRKRAGKVSEAGGVDVRKGGLPLCVPPALELGTETNGTRGKSPDGTLTCLWTYSMQGHRKGGGPNCQQFPLPDPSYPTSLPLPPATAALTPYAALLRPPTPLTLPEAWKPSEAGFPEPDTPRSHKNWGFPFLGFPSPVWAPDHG